MRKNGDADPYEQYVYDQRYIDAPVMVYRDTNTDGTVDQKLYVVEDANYDVTATINGDTGAVVNRFVYAPYGQQTVLTASWAAGTADFTLGHQGLMLDVESGMYYNRARSYHPTLGVFVQRDPLGYVDGESLYQYVRSRPGQLVDPTGQVVPIIIGGVVITFAVLQEAALITGATVATCLMIPPCRDKAIALAKAAADKAGDVWDGVYGAVIVYINPFVKPCKITLRPVRRSRPPKKPGCQCLCIKMGTGPIPEGRVSSAADCASRCAAKYQSFKSICT